MIYLAIAAAAYLLGSSNMAYWLSRLRKVDIQSHGSGNLGASNATVLLGWGAGALVAVHDIAKGLLAVLVVKLVFPGLEYAGAVAGVAAVLGHIFPFYLQFRGGKGLATFLGMTLALNWKLGAAVAVLLVAVTVVTDYIALGTLSVAAVVPVGLFLQSGSLLLVLIIGIATVVMFVKHRDNLLRIWNHTEIGLRSTAKGENRLK